MSKSSISKICSVEGCNKQLQAKNYCSAHYRRNELYGSPHILKNRPHGMIYTPTYKSWANMKDRCLNKNNRAYKWYGAKGINVCDKWLSFIAFFNDMGEMPLGFSIERIDTKKGYCKDNCEWIPRRLQGVNKSSTVFIEHNGEVRSMSDWERYLGMSCGLLSARIKAGMSLDKALTKERVTRSDKGKKKKLASGRVMVSSAA